jgi:hypothetical protein
MVKLDLRQRLGRGEKTNNPRPEGSLSLKRRVLIWVLIVLGALCVAISTFSVWIRETALNTNGWTKTSGQLLQSENVQESLSAYLVNQVFDSTDVQARLEERLPEALQPLAAPAAAALRSAAFRTVNQLLASAQFQTLWEEANRVAHERFVALIEGKSKNLVLEGNDVVLDLRPMVEAVAARVGLPSGVTTRLSERAGQIVILEDTQLQTVRKAVNALRVVSFFLVIVAVALWALAVYLSRGRRREAVRGISLSLVVVAVIVLVVRGIGGNAIISAVVKTTSVEPAAQDVWDIFTEVLRDATIAMLIVGIFGVLWSWLSGPGRRAIAFRRFAAPTFRDHPGLVHGGLALLILLFLVWAPVGAPRRLITTLIVIVLMFVGLELLRRQAVREAASEPAEQPAQAQTLPG